MLHRDYIMRMIQQMARFLGQIIAKKESGLYDEALGDVQTAFKQLLGLDPKAVKTLPEREILAILGLRGRIHGETCLAVAQLLKQEAEVLELQQRGNEEVGALYLKSLFFFLESFARNEALRSDTNTAEVEFILTKAQAYELPGHTKAGLLPYFEGTGRYARAEDVLFDLVDADYPGIVEQGIEFYQRLLQKDDADLAAGDLPRQEVEEGLETLKTKRAQPQSE